MEEANMLDAVQAMATDGKFTPALIAMVMWASLYLLYKGGRLGARGTRKLYAWMRSSRSFTNPVAMKLDELLSDLTAWTKGGHEYRRTVPGTSRSQLTVWTSEGGTQISLNGVEVSALDIPKAERKSIYRKAGNMLTQLRLRDSMADLGGIFPTPTAVQAAAGAAAASALFGNVENTANTGWKFGSDERPFVLYRLGINGYEEVSSFDSLYTARLTAAGMGLKDGKISDYRVRPGSRDWNSAFSVNENA